MRIIVGDLLIDANGIKKDPVIQVEGDRISKVGSRDDLDIPVDAQVIDASGSILMPGLIDCHVHFQGTKERTELKIAERYETRLIKAAVQEAPKMLEMGFTSVLLCVLCGEFSQFPPVFVAL